MNRSITNFIRILLDECIPPIIRDSRWFMYPLFYIWYKGKNLPLYMDFKSLVYDMTPEQYAAAYRNHDSWANDRPTDMNEPSIRHMLAHIDESAKTLLDVGCGRGYWLERVTASTELAVTGCDLYDEVALEKGAYVKGNAEQLPFADNSFDVVTCTCILEHLVKLDQAVSELRRVARKQVIVVVPCQRYFYYTLDMHIHFFPIESMVQAVMQMKNYRCTKIWGDWVYIGEK
jgi:ubiquinone/menaquinone biosynthesis C-methylase UbiE